MFEEVSITGATKSRYSPGNDNDDTKIERISVSDKVTKGLLEEQYDKLDARTTDGYV